MMDIHTSQSFSLKEKPIGLIKIGVVVETINTDLDWKFEINSKSFNTTEV